MFLLQHVRQFHQEGSTVEEEYRLGSFAPHRRRQEEEGEARRQEEEEEEAEEQADDADDAEAYTPKLNRKHPERSFAAAMYTGGDPCELDEWGVSRRRETCVRKPCERFAAFAAFAVPSVSAIRTLLIFVCR